MTDEIVAAVESFLRSSCVTAERTSVLGAAASYSQTRWPSVGEPEQPFIWPGDVAGPSRLHVWLRQRAREWSPESAYLEAAEAVGRAIASGLEGNAGPMRALRGDIQQLRSELQSLRSAVAALSATQSAAEDDEPGRTGGGVPAVSTTSCTQSAELLSLEDERYELGEPIPVVVEFLPDKVVVSDDQVNMYGSGLTLNEALIDYRASLVEYFEWLETHERTLALHLRGHLEWLRSRMRLRESRDSASGS